MDRTLAVVFFTTAFLVIGCAEGPLWKTGSYSPWVREKWEAEEQIADTLFKRKRALDTLVVSAANGSEQDRKAAAIRLGEIVQRDPVLLLRLHAVRLLGQLNHPAAAEALKQAGTHPDSFIRIAAIDGWRAMPAELAVGPLQEIVGSDTDADVRLEATKALGQFRDPAASQALSLALTDSNPAIQLRATESLSQITGQDFGPNVSAWQSFLQNQQGQRFADSGSSNGSDTKTR